MFYLRLINIVDSAGNSHEEIALEKINPQRHYKSKPVRSLKTLAEMRQMSRYSI